MGREKVFWRVIKGLVEALGGEIFFIFALFIVVF